MVAASEMTTAELVFTPFRMTQFLSVTFVIGVVPTEPSTTTFAASRFSAAVKNRPSSTLRARTSSHEGVVPTAVVDQFDVDVINVAEE